MWKSSDNKSLIVMQTVHLTNAIDDVIADLDPHFERAEKHAFVTSGYRSEQEQLDLIIREAHRHNLIDDYPEILVADLNGKMTWRDGSIVYTWQPAWSALLNLGFIVNPPLPAICLLDSLRPNGSNRKGQSISASPHRFGKSFDIGGGKYGPQEIAEVLAAAKLDTIRGWLVERQNNAVHVDVQ